MADELDIAAPEIEGIEDAVGISCRGVCEDVLIHSFLPADACHKVLNPAEQHGPVEQHEVEPVSDDQRKQQRHEGQSNGWRHHFPQSTAAG